MNMRQDQSLQNGPLAGVKIVEYGVFHAGPGANAILGDLGAEIIKIEAGLGDPERYWTVVGGVDIAVPGGDSIMFEVSNRNKKGIYLDIKKEKGREIFNRLIKDADIFLTNLRKSTKIKMGLDYETIRKINSAIIYASVSGYGTKGPAADLGAFDPMGMARSGMMYLNDPERPSLMHLAILDQATAISMSHAILAALFARERHGVGQEVDTSLYSSGLWLMYCNLVIKSILDVDSGFSWNRLANSPLRNSFRCADGKWIIGVHHPEEKYWETFCEAIDHQELINNPRFADNEARRKNCAELVPLFDNILATRTRDAWLEIFQKRGLMFSPVQHVSEILEDPQALLNDYVVEFDHPSLGRVKLPGYPAHFSAARAGTRSHAPSIGEHTEEVLKTMGYSDKDLQELREEEVIR